MAPNKLGVLELEVSCMLLFLKTYTARRDAKILEDGFTFGFRLGYSGLRTSSTAPNFKSVRELQALLHKKINREIQMG